MNFAIDQSDIFGRLTLEAFKHGPIESGANVSMGIVTLFIIAILTYTKRWKWIWNEWLTSLDPKKIGMMYIIVALAMLFKGITDAAMMRAQQALSVGSSFGYLTPEHFQQLFTAHGTTMIFFVAMGVIFGYMNLIVPLQIGARDIAFPFLNAVSFWLFSVGAILVNLSLAIGEFAGTGWLSYPPLSGIQFSPGVGVDYWIWALQISGIGSLFTGINFLVTIFRMRCPGMTFWNMPIYIWSVLGALMLVIFAFPILTATLTMLALDRLFNFHFFTADYGGNFMMFINYIWAWGHPEVYILQLPAFGIFSEVVATFSRKRLFGYVSMVWALIAITFLSFIVWVHHFFTMGAGGNVNSFFGIMTMLISVPTGVKIFNWLMTMYGGRVRFTTPMLWFLAFLFNFTLGGMAGVLLSVPAFDFQVHNSLFLIAHFHTMVIGGVLFGTFSGFSYWFPKIVGFKLNETIGKWAFAFWVIGFILAFSPLYILGFMGATRRLDHYETTTGWQPLFIIAAVGVVLIFIGFFFQILQILVSIKQRKQNMDTTGDPWDGRTLEWSITSPPPFYNYATIPVVHSRDPFWEEKEKGMKLTEKPGIQEFHMPKNSPFGLYIGIFAFLFGFAIIWHIFWLVLVGLIGILTCMIIRLSDDHTEYVVTVEEIKKIEENA